MALFQTKIQKARLSLSPFTAEQMVGIGNVLLNSIKNRIRQGINSQDQDAKPLKAATKGRYVPYARYKQNRGLAPIRDWTYTGRTMRSMKVLTASENRFQIGFTDAKADKIAHINNLYDKMFGTSPTDMKALTDAVYNLWRTGGNIQFVKVA